PAEAKQWVDDYYHILKEECVPIGHAVNPNICMVTGFSVHRDGEEARRRGLDGFKFFGYALGHHYIFGEHRPGRTNIWQKFEAAGQKRKMKALAPFIEQAMARKQRMKELADDKIPTVLALGRQIAQRAAEEEKTASIWSQTAAMPLDDPARPQRATRATG